MAQVERSESKKAPAGASKKQPKKPTEMGRRFAFWADTIQRNAKTLEVINSWVDGVAMDNPQRKTLQKMARDLENLGLTSNAIKEGWAALSEAKFVPPKVIGPQGFVKGAVVKYRPEELKRVLQYGGDAEVWGGEFVITHVNRNEKTGALLLSGHSKVDKAFPFGHLTSNKFKLVK